MGMPDAGNGRLITAWKVDLALWPWDIILKEMKQMVVPDYKQDVQKLKRILQFIGEKLNNDDRRYLYTSMKYDMSIYNYDMAIDDIDKAELITTPFLDILDYCIGYLYYYVLNFCGCGSPDAILDYLTDIFECMEDVDHPHGALMFSHNKYLEKFYDIYDKWLYYEFTLKWMDTLGWIDHGTSIYYSFLTEEGEEWRNLLLLRRKYKNWRTKRNEI
jgi:hypothetical protein